MFTPPAWLHLADFAGESVGQFRRQGRDVADPQSPRPLWPNARSHGANRSCERRCQDNTKYRRPKIATVERSKQSHKLFSHLPITQVPFRTVHFLLGTTYLELLRYTFSSNSSSWSQDSLKNCQEWKKINGGPWRRLHQRGSG